MKMENGFEGFGIHEGINVLLTEKQIKRAMDVLPPEAKQTLTDCLRKRRVDVNVFADEAAIKYWLVKCVEVFFGWHHKPRGPCLDQLRILGAHASPDQITARTHARKPLAAGDESLFPPPALPKDVFSPDPPAAKKSTKKKHQVDEMQQIIVVVGITAGISFLLTAVLFFIFFLGNRNKQVGPVDYKRDDRPLLNLSDMSNGKHLLVLFCNWDMIECILWSQSHSLL